MNLTRYVGSERDSALLVGDYNTYRIQATRRIYALRKRLGQATPKGRKYSAKPPITAEDIGQDNDFAKLLLMCAERAWAGAMAMKSAHSMDSTQNKITGSTKKQIISRLNRAVQYAKHLMACVRDAEASQSKDTDTLEAEAYLAGLRGSVQFEKGRWTACIKEYSIARVINAALGSGTTTDIFKDILSSTVDPSIRYAAYQSKLPRTKAVSEIAIEYFPQEEGALRKQIEEINASAFVDSKNAAMHGKTAAGNTPSTITWRGRTVKIEDASIAQAVAIANAKEAEYSQSTTESILKHRELATAYDDILNARQDAVDATKSAIDELMEEGVDASDTRVQSLQVTRTALKYSVIELRIGRNRVLCGPNDGAFSDHAHPLISPGAKKGIISSSKEQRTGPRLGKLREKVALYDSILQDIDAVKELPGVPGDTDFVEELCGKESYFRALKCLSIGQSHAAAENMVNSLALYSRSLDLLTKTPFTKSVATQVPKYGLPKLDPDSKDFTTLRDHLNRLVSQKRAMVDLKNLMDEDKASAEVVFKPAVVDRLDEYPVNDINLADLVNFPPKLQPIPVKPLFFDLAWNYIDYPGRSRSVANGAPTGPKPGAEEKKESTKKGWFGFGR